MIYTNIPNHFFQLKRISILTLKINDHYKLLLLLYSSQTLSNSAIISSTTSKLGALTPAARACPPPPNGVNTSLTTGPRDLIEPLILLLLRS